MQTSGGVIAQEPYRHHQAPFDREAPVKWLLSILGSVLAGIVVWWLTREGGAFNPKRNPIPLLPREPHIMITAFEVDRVRANAETLARFTVYNDGESPLEGCRVEYWYVGESGWSPGQAHSDAFGLPPKQSTNQSAVLWRWETGWKLSSVEQGTLHARARCGNVISTTLDRSAEAPRIVQ